LFPHLVNLSALSLRWFRGSMRDFLGEIYYGTVAENQLFSE